MRILRVITRMNIGGPARQVSFLHDALNRDTDIEHRLVYGQLDKDEGDFSNLIQNHEGVTFLKSLVRPISIGKDIKAFCSLVKIILDFKPDIIHTHTAKAGLLTRCAGIFVNTLNGLSFKKKIILMHTYHGHVFSGYFSPLKNKVFRALERILWGFTDKLLVLTESQQKEITSLLNVNPVKTAIVPLGLDLEKYLSIERTDYFNQRFSVELKQWVGWIGRLASIKNPLRFIDMIESYLSESKNLDVGFVLVGDGSEKQFVLDRISESPFKSQIFYYGWSDDLIKIYSGLDAFVNTSDNEGTPVAVLEAMSVGIPVLASDVGGTCDVLQSVLNSKVFNIENWEKDVSLNFREILNSERSSIKDRKKIVETFSRARLKKDLKLLYQKFS